jgi:hypothetical protein
MRRELPGEQLGRPLPQWVRVLGLGRTVRGNLGAADDHHKQFVLLGYKLQHIGYFLGLGRSEVCPHLLVAPQAWYTTGHGRSGDQSTDS